MSTPTTLPRVSLGSWMRTTLRLAFYGECCHRCHAPLTRADIVNERGRCPACGGGLDPFAIDEEERR